MKLLKRSFCMLLVFLMLSGFGLIALADGDAQALTITAASDSVRRKKTLALSINTTEPVTWQSSDDSIATVDQSGVVTGKNFGMAIISAKTLDGQTAEFKVYVVRANSPLRNALSKRQMFGYRYNYKGDYFYTDDKDCWQKSFGFNFAYDWAAPLFAMKYDYVRIFFPYEGKDWMIQMWKGQYGYLFFGSEVGVYTKPIGEQSATSFAHYSSPEESDYLQIGNALYHEDRSTGTYELEYEHPYDSYWWNAAFVPGHLRSTKPCDELRTVTHITFKSAEMAKLFTDGLKDCGFAAVRSESAVVEDSFYRNGADVYLKWQNISQESNAGEDIVGRDSVAVTGALSMLMASFFSSASMLALGGLALLILL
ncbi:MAG: DUF4474 domain-containing protein [Clostridia bacterium]|nr:DUF4474 domain-containing protein [Clostridia bacterium]